VNRPGVAISAVLLMAASCTGGRLAGAPSMVTPTSLLRTPSSTPSPVVLERLVLTADLSEKPARWRRVIFVPFGKRPSQLGFKTFRESLNSQPSSFAVDSDGSFWIVDRWKDRIAHYSVAGRFLGAVAVPEPPAGVSVGPGHERMRDAVFAGGRMFALIEPTGGPVVEVDPNGSVRYLRPKLKDRYLSVAEILPSAGPLVMLVGGFVNPENGFVDDGPLGYFQWDLAGPPQPIPGVPSDRGTWIQLQSFASAGGGDQDFELRFLRTAGAIVQPFYVEVRTRSGAGGRSLVAEVGPGNLIPAGEDLVMYVMLSPSRPADASRYGGGRWLLRLGRSPVLWERLPDPGIPDEPQSRHLALGPDGTIYLMVAEKRGMAVFRRP
jgi:hypothetical protein